MQFGHWTALHAMSIIAQRIEKTIPGRMRIPKRLAPLTCRSRKSLRKIDRVTSMKHRFIEILTGILELKILTCRATSIGSLRYFTTLQLVSPPGGSRSCKKWGESPEAEHSPQLGIPRPLSRFAGNIIQAK